MDDLVLTLIPLLLFAALVTGMWWLIGGHTEQATLTEIELHVACRCDDDCPFCGRNDAGL